MDAMGPAHHHRLLVPECLLFDDSLEGSKVADDHVEGFFEKQGEGRVDDIIGGQSEMDIVGVFADVLSYGLEEGDDIVFDHPLDFLDPGKRKSRLFLDPLKSRPRDPADFGPGLANGQLDVQPSAVPVIIGPNSAHRGAGVSFDHPMFL